MFDTRLRPLIDPALDRLASGIVRLGLGANTVTLIGFACGIGAAAAVSLGGPWAGLALFVANRVLDGLDGAVARRLGPRDFGGYLDIVLDFIVYAAVPTGFAYLDPAANALPAVVLVFSFMGTGSSFLAYAIVAAKRGFSAEIRGKKSFYHLGGLIEGTETILFFILCFLMPERFAVLAYVFTALCWITTATRIAAAWDAFGKERRD